MGGDGMILLRRKGFDPDIAKKLRSFEHEEQRQNVAIVGEGRVEGKEMGVALLPR